MMLICGFCLGQQVRKPDLGKLLDGYRNDPLLAETIAALTLPTERAAERHAMLTRLGKEGEFPRWADMVTYKVASDGNEEAILDFHESIVLWLEQSDPSDLHEMNLSWVTCGAQRFFGEISNRRFPDLFKGDWRKVAAEWDKRDKGCLELAERKYRLARRLALSLIRFHSTAEEGFRLLSAAGGMDFPEEEMDAAARIALAVTGNRPHSPHSRDPFFQLRHKSGGSGGDSFDRHSSVRWLSARLAVEPADAVIPPSWLAALAAADPGRAEMVAAMRERCGSAKLEQLWTPDRVGTTNIGPVTAMLFREIFIRSTVGSGSESFFAGKLRETASRRNPLDSIENSPLSLLIRGALLAATTSDEAGRESLCRLVGTVMYGEGEVRDEIYTQAITKSGEFTMQRIFVDWPFDDKAVSLRLLATLHRLRIPVGASFHAVTPMFHGKPPLSFEDTEKLLESAGWLRDARQWNPPRVFSRDLRLDPQKRKRMMIKESLISRVLVDHPEFDNFRFAAWLKERETHRFGALLFASQLVHQQEGDALVLSAFSEMGEGWPGNANSPPPPFSLITEMMAPESAAKLPAFLRPQR